MATGDGRGQEYGIGLNPHEVEYTVTPTRESAKSRIRYKIEEYQRKAEDLQALLDALELMQTDYVAFAAFSDKVDRILYEMVCKLK